MNPNVGANFILEAQKSTSAASDGFRMREAEFSFKSDVDPYFTANMIFSVAEESPGTYSVTPEEVYADTTGIPGLTLRFGKFYNAFGKQNRLHTHAYTFVDAPLINTLLLGDGLNSVGISGSWLIPTAFFSELTIQAAENLYTLAHLKTVFDVSDFATLEVGVSAITRWAWGLDFTWKHRPTDRGQGRRFNLAGEWMSGSLQGFTPAPDPNGLPTQGFDLYSQYEFLPRVYFQYRFDDVISHSLTRHGILFAYAPSEFSVLRLQADRGFAPGALPESRIIAQTNFTIGFHPAHDY